MCIRDRDNAELADEIEEKILKAVGIIGEDAAEDPADDAAASDK